jgi:hypothetical protein
MKTVTAIVVSNPLVDLADQINREHRAANGAMQKGLEHALSAGKLLRDAKEHVGHGGWTGWLEANCHVSKRSAQAYMRLAREFTKLEPAKAQRVADLSFRDAMAALSTETAGINRLPDTAIDAAVEMAEDGNSLKSAVSYEKNQQAVVKARDASVESAATAPTMNLITTRPPTQEEKELMAFEDRLQAALWAACREHCANHPSMPQEAVLTAINEIYSAVQDSWLDLIGAPEASPEAATG